MLRKKAKFITFALQNCFRKIEYSLQEQRANVSKQFTALISQLNHANSPC